MWFIYILEQYINVSMERTWKGWIQPYQILKITKIGDVFVNVQVCKLVNTVDPVATQLSSSTRVLS